MCYEPSPFNRKWYSHKFKRAGLTYEIGLNVHTGDICWAFGGFPAGLGDLDMARKGVLKRISRREKIIADNGYIGLPDKIIVPSDDVSSIENKRHKLLMARHEHINKRVKDFKCMNSIWRHGWKAHIMTFYAIVNIVQIKLETMEPMPLLYLLEE